MENSLSKPFQYEASKYQSGSFSLVKDFLTAEEGLRIQINRQPYTLTMRSPGYEEDLIRGILFTEQVYTATEGRINWEVLTQNDAGFITQVNVMIPQEQIGPGINLARNLMSVSSCGLCGVSEHPLQIEQKLERQIRVQASCIPDCFESMKQAQTEFAHTGGCHAAAAFTEHGALLVCREDIGRHNAVDKVIGSLINNNQLSQAAILVVSGRVSFEIVQKTHKAGIPILGAVSAPSTMAVTCCRQGGITLLAFCRGRQFTVYSFPENISQQE